MGNKRPQNGHSKSENSTIVIGAVAGPRAGYPAVSISVRCGACAAAVAIARATGMRKVMALIIRRYRAHGNRRGLGDAAACESVNSCLPAEARRAKAGCVRVADGVMMVGK